MTFEEQHAVPSDRITGSPIGEITITISYKTLAGEAVSLVSTGSAPYNGNEDKPNLSPYSAVTTAISQLGLIAELSGYGEAAREAADSSANAAVGAKIAGLGSLRKKLRQKMLAERA